MIFLHYTKSTKAIGQNQPRVFLLHDNNESFECSFDNNAQKTRIIHSKYLQILHKAKKMKTKLIVILYMIIRHIMYISFCTF